MGKRWKCFCLTLVGSGFNFNDNAPILFLTGACALRPCVWSSYSSFSSAPGLSLPLRVPSADWEPSGFLRLPLVQPSQLPRCADCAHTAVTGWRLGVCLVVAPAHRLTKSFLRCLHEQSSLDLLGGSPASPACFGCQWCAPQPESLVAVACRPRRRFPRLAWAGVPHSRISSSYCLQAKTMVVPICSVCH